MKHSDDPPRQPDPIRRVKPEDVKLPPILDSDSAFIFSLGFMILMICVGCAFVITAIGFACRG